MSFEAIQFDRKTGHNFLLDTASSPELKPSAAKRKAAYIALTLAVGSGLFASYEQATTSDSKVCTEVSSNTDEATRKASAQLRKQGANVTSYKEVNAALDQAGYSESGLFAPVSICQIQHGGISGEIADFVFSPLLTVEPIQQG